MITKCFLDYLCNSQPPELRDVICPFCHDDNCCILYSTWKQYQPEWDRKVGCRRCPWSVTFLMDGRSAEARANSYKAKVVKVIRINRRRKS